MIKRKEKYETPQFAFWLTEYAEGSYYPYDLILASTNVAPHLSKEELKGLADFITKFLNDNTDSH